MKKTNLLLNITLGFLLKVFAIIKGQKIIEKTKIEGPAIVLSNHTSFYDFIYTSSVLYPKRVTYLAASKMFYEKKTRFFLKIARAIPKSLMQADPVATLKAFRILKKKGLVAIFPEGQISPSGKTLKPSYSIAKFLKKADVDIFIIKHYGAGLVNPPWSNKTFKGKIETKEYLMLSQNELRNKSLDEIYDLVVKNLQYSNSNYVHKNHYSYRLNDIKNLENVIYQCPKCFHEGLISEKKQLSCPKCGYQLVYDVHGLLNHEGVDVLFEKQANRLKTIINQHVNYELCGKAKLMSFRNQLLSLVGEGTLCVKRYEYIYQGTIDGVYQRLTFKVENTPTLPSDIGRNVQIYEDDQIYQFEMEEAYLPTKFVHVSEHLFAIYNNELS